MLIFYTLIRYRLIGEVFATGDPLVRDGPTECDQVQQ
jgi:hypothetical protein